MGGQEDFFTAPIQESNQDDFFSTPISSKDTSIPTVTLNENTLQPSNYSGKNVDVISNITIKQFKDNPIFQDTKNQDIYFNSLINKGYTTDDVNAIKDNISRSVGVEPPPRVKETYSVTATDSPMDMRSAIMGDVGGKKNYDILQSTLDLFNYDPKYKDANVRNAYYDELINKGVKITPAFKNNTENLITKNKIEQGKGWYAFINPAGEPATAVPAMIGAGIDKMIKGGEMWEEGAALPEVFPVGLKGMADVALGALSTTPGGIKFIQAINAASSVAPKLTEKAMAPVSSITGLDPKTETGKALLSLADFAVFGLFIAEGHNVKEYVNELPNLKNKQYQIRELTERFGKLTDSQKANAANLWADMKMRQLNDPNVPGVPHGEKTAYRIKFERLRRAADHKERNAQSQPIKDSQHRGVTPVSEDANTVIVSVKKDHEDQALKYEQAKAEIKPDFTSINPAPGTVPLHFENLTDYIQNFNPTQPINEVASGLSVKYRGRNGKISKSESGEITFTDFSNGKSEIITGGGDNTPFSNLGLKVNEGTTVVDGRNYYVQGDNSGYTIYEIKDGKMTPKYESGKANESRRDAIIRKALNKTPVEIEMDAAHDKVTQLESDIQNNKDKPLVVAALQPTLEQAKVEAAKLETDVADQHAASAQEEVIKVNLQDNIQQMEQALPDLSGAGKEKVQADLYQAKKTLDEINATPEATKNKTNEITVYHHTEGDGVIDNRNEGIWFTDNKHGVPGRSRAGTSVIEKTINPSELKLANEKQFMNVVSKTDSWSERAKLLKDEGFDGVKRTVNGDKHYWIFDVNKLKDEVATPEANQEGIKPTTNEEVNQKGGQEELLTQSTEPVSPVVEPTTTPAGEDAGIKPQDNATTKSKEPIQEGDQQAGVQEHSGIGTSRETAPNNEADNSNSRSNGTGKEVSNIQVAKDKLREAKDRANKLRDQTNLGTSTDPFKKTREQALADREVLDTYVDLAKEYIKNGINTLKDFAKEIGEDISDTLTQAWGIANKGDATKERLFANQILESKDISKSVKEGLSADALEYIPKDNALSQAEALAIIDIKGEQNSLDMIKDLKNDLKPSVRVFIGENLIKRFNKTDVNKAIETAEFLTDYGTQLGQGVQAFAPFGFLTPEGQIKYTVREVARNRSAKVKDAKTDIDKKSEQMRQANKDAIDEVLDNVVVEKKKTSLSKEKQIRKSELRKKFGSVFHDITDIPKLLLDKEFIEYNKLILEEAAGDFKQFVKLAIKEFGKNVTPHLRDLYKAAGGKRAIGDVDVEVKRALKQLDVDIKDIVKKHYTEYDDTMRTLTEKLIEDAGLSDEEAKSLAREIQYEFDKIATKTKQDLLNNKLNKKNIIKSKQTQNLYDSIIELSNLGAFSDKDFTDLYADKMGFPKITPEQAAEITRLANAVQAAPEGILKFRATEDLLKYQSKIPGINWGEVAQSVWYANILSGYTTQQVNTVANLFNTAALLGVATAKNPVSLPILVKGLWNGWGRGLLEAGDVLKTGYAPIRSKIETPNVLERYQFSGGKINPLNYYKYVQRAMNAADVFAYEGLKNMRAHELALREANKRGTKTLSKGIWKKVDEELLNTKDRISSAESTAKSEGLKGADYKRRVYELIEQSRPVQMMEDAKTFAAKGTFNYDPEGTIGLLTSGVSKIVEAVDIAGVKPLKFIVPFTRIIANVANNALDYTPYGYLRATKNATGFRSYEKYELGKNKFREFTPEERKDAIIKATMGTLAMGSLYMLSEPDKNGKSTIEITANGTGDFKKNYELASTGWQPYSIKINNNWYSYQNTPMGIALATIGYMRDVEKYKGGHGVDSLKKLSLVVYNTLTYLTDMTFLSSLSEFIGSLGKDNPAQAENYFKNLVTKSVKSFVVPNLYSQAAKQVEVINNSPMKEVNNLYDSLIQDIPIARNSLNDRINALGEPVIPNTDKFISDVKYNPVWQFIVDHQAWIGKPNKGSIYIMDGDIERGITDDEYFNFIKLSGSKIKDGIKELMKDSKDMTGAEIKDEVDRIKTQARKDAKYELFNK